ncbi:MULTISPECIES: response regulator transcription factor [unclassified Paenibacillus]|uniref:response regulator transcription factor n=1 Tax=unclassified Paenibacillus TaxID=185978 RepID=UPI001C10C303|nr:MULTISPECIES: response regulator transcription factor [unclassified Paenibacillus]MBU5445331.1 response regulator transcription factor [Paenibacillus sp. MSJ-34]CAH0120608.1 Response regulator protein GraR [Paenibacillus sp. CECT 9249]
MYRVLIVEDDGKIAAILAQTLEKYGYEVVRADNFADIKKEVEMKNPHIVLLDINLPYFDGYYWCRQIRTFSNVPIIFVSARVGNMDQVMAIENGGDDYITKPFHLDVIVAKVKSALRRAYGEYAAPAAEQADQTGVPGLKLDPSRNTLQWQGHKTELTKNECLLLQCLVMKPGVIVPREELLELLWDDVQFVDDNTLSVNITRVRKKLEEIGLVKAIETVRGQGYRFLAPEGGSGNG